jgi:hypothetical protein
VRWNYSFLHDPLENSALEVALMTCVTFGYEHFREVATILSYKRKERAASMRDISRVAHIAIRDSDIRSEVVNLIARISELQSFSCISGMPLPCRPTFRALNLQQGPSIMFITKSNPVAGLYICSGLLRAFSDLQNIKSMYGFYWVLSPPCTRPFGRI